MLSTLAKLGISTVVISAFLYQIALKDLLFVSIGVARTIQPLSDFPYQCHRLEDPRLQACEDMWLSESNRILYLACSDPFGRQQWMPKLNVSGRSQKDAIIAMSIDEPQEESYTYKILSTPGFSRGGNELHVLGITGRDRNDGMIELLLTNNKPRVDPSTAFHNHFQLFDAESSLNGEHSFWIANDHGPHKIGLKHHLSPIVGTADITYCSFDHSTKTANCNPVVTGLRFPNGLIKGRDGLVYVPFSSPGGINVYKPSTNGSLTKTDNIDIDYGLDNISQGADGTIFAAGFPKLVPALKAYEDPMNVFPPSTIFKIKEVGDGYVWEKAIEDNGEALGMSTVAISDAKTGRLFMGSAISPFVTVCEKAP